MQWPVPTFADVLDARRRIAPHLRPTPLYGYAALARYPLTDGWTPTGTHDPVWLPVANVLAWTVIFAVVALWGLRRGQERV